MNLSDAFVIAKNLIVKGTIEVTDPLVAMLQPHAPTATKESSKLKHAWDFYKTVGDPSMRQEYANKLRLDMHWHHDFLYDLMEEALLPDDMALVKHLLLTFIPHPDSAFYERLFHAVRRPFLPTLGMGNARNKCLSMVVWAFLLRTRDDEILEEFASALVERNAMSKHIAFVRDALAMCHKEHGNIASPACGILLDAMVDVARGDNRQRSDVLALMEGIWVILDRYKDDARQTELARCIVRHNVMEPFLRRRMDAPGHATISPNTPLGVLLRAFIEATLQTPAPTFTWAMPRRIDGHPEVEAFLRSPEAVHWTYRHRFSSITEARQLAYRMERSVTATPGGKGRQAFVHFVKNRSDYHAKCQAYHQTQALARQWRQRCMDPANPSPDANPDANPAKRCKTTDTIVIDDSD